MSLIRAIQTDVSGDGMEMAKEAKKTQAMKMMLMNEKSFVPLHSPKSPKSVIGLSSTPERP